MELITYISLPLGSRMGDTLTWAQSWIGDILTWAQSRMGRYLSFGDDVLSGRRRVDYFMKLITDISLPLGSRLGVSHPSAMMYFQGGRMIICA
jgi:hypothetical protein